MHLNKQANKQQIGKAGIAAIMLLSSLTVMVGTALTPALPGQAVPARLLSQIMPEAPMVLLTLPANPRQRIRQSAALPLPQRAYLFP